MIQVYNAITDALFKLVCFASAKVIIMEQKEVLLRQLLNKIAKEQKYENYDLIINETSSGGANYSSKLFTVIIREANKEDLHLFAKVAAAGEAVRKEMPSMIKMYDVERFAYTKLSTIYASLEEENGVPEEHRLHFTKCYGFDASRNQEILILENLLALGYGPHDRFHSYDWEYAYSAVKDMAKMHALSLAFSQKNPEEFEKTLEDLKMDFSESDAMVNSTKELVKVSLDKVDPKYRDALEKFMEGKPNPDEMTGAITRPVIIHGDFRGSNLLHRVREVSFTNLRIRF